MRAFAPTLAITVLALATALPAQARHGGHHGGHGWHGQHGGWHHKHHGHHGHHGHHRGNVWGPLIVGGLIGAAVVGASSAHAQVQPQTLVVPVAPSVPSHLVPAPIAPPMVTAPPQPLPPRVQYYCASYRAYYPFVANCPEPWYVMPY